MLSKVRPAQGPLPLWAGIERQQIGLIALLNKDGFPFILLQISMHSIKTENKHHRHSRSLLFLPHLLPCPRVRFKAVPIASATCSPRISFLCPVVHHFSIFQARARQAIIQDLPDNLSFSHFPEGNNGPVFRGWG